MTETSLLDDLLTPDEAASLLSVRKKWLYEAAAAERIPHTRVGRFLRFSRSELKAWLLAQHRG